MAVDGLAVPDAELPLPPPGAAAKFGGNGNADSGFDSLLSLIEKFAGGDIGTFGRLIVNDGEMGSQSDVSISTASRSVVGVACVERTTGRVDGVLGVDNDVIVVIAVDPEVDRRPAEVFWIAPKFSGARSLHNLLAIAPCVSTTTEVPDPAAVLLLVLVPVTVTSATVVTIVLPEPPPPLPPGSISVWFFSLMVRRVVALVAASLFPLIPVGCSPG